MLKRIFPLGIAHVTSAVRFAHQPDAEEDGDGVWPEFRDAALCGFLDEKMPRPCLYSQWKPGEKACWAASSRISCWPTGRKCAGNVPQEPVDSRL